MDAKKGLVEKFNEQFPGFKETWENLKKEFNIVAPVVAPVTTPAPEPAKFGQGSLQDGTAIQWDGDTLAVNSKVQVVDPANPGGFLPIPDGEYVMKNGTNFVIVNGVVTELEAPAAENVEPTDTNNPAPQIPAMMADYPWDQCIADQMKQYNDMSIAEKVCGAIKAGNVGMKAHVALASKLVDLEIKLSKIEKEKADKDKEVSESKVKFEAQTKEIEAVKVYLKKVEGFVDTLLGASMADPANKPDGKLSKKENLFNKLK